MNIFLGVDIGSISANFALITPDKRIVNTSYIRVLGDPVKVVFNTIKNISSDYKIKGLSFTGTGGRFFKNLAQCNYINEIASHVQAAGYNGHQVRTIIEIGGQDSKLIFTEFTGKELQLKNFVMNTVCAAGCGAFLDHQATRLNISMDQFGEYALKSKQPAHIAGRCSVFAKSDMIHLQQESTPIEDILYGLCLALARNYIATLGRGQILKEPILFQGGVAANKGMIRAFESLLNTKLMIPSHYNCMGAIGAAIEALKKNINTDIQMFLTKLKQYKITIEKGLPPLKTKQSKHKIFTTSFSKSPLYIGVDIGSVSTKLVVIDNAGNLVIKRYLLSEGKPVKSTKKILESVKNEIGSMKIAGVGVTGSGRYLIGALLGADIFKDEITAQAKAANFQNAHIDTIFEIGGQDSKYIRLQNDTVVEFEMNKACTAGTGAFLEEQASRLDINIKDFGDISLSAFYPVSLGERCTVFMESDLIHYQQIGTTKENLAAGLCYSIAYNYLNKVVSPHKIGEYIALQGGVAFNKGVIAAFEYILGKKIFIPEHHEVTGALGIALITKESNIEKTNFRGFLLNSDYKLETFECKICSNNCKIKQLIVNEKKTYYGSRCGRYDKDYNDYNSNNSLFKEYNKTLNIIKPFKFKRKIGFPFCLGLYEFLPFWSVFFRNLGYFLIKSNPNKDLIDKGLKLCSADLCYPFKILYSNILDLERKDVEFIFLPYITQILESKYMCPFIQTAPDIIKATMHKVLSKPLLTPTIDMANYKTTLKQLEQLAKPLHCRASRIRFSYKEANRVQLSLKYRLEEIAKKQLRLSEKEQTIILIGKCYNIFDEKINLGIPQILEKLFSRVVPITLFPDFKNNNFYSSDIYWFYGEKIINLGLFIKDKPNLYPVYLTNFGCGQDSMLIQIFQKIINKPYLVLEVDEHSSSVGIITRCEAFANTLKKGV